MADNAAVAELPADRKKDNVFFSSVRLERPCRHIKYRARVLRHTHDAIPHISISRCDVANVALKLPKIT